MAINIIDAETEFLAKELACRTGETITDVIRSALQERLQWISGRQHVPIIDNKERVNEILRRVDALSTEDHCEEDEILGYDKNGIPR